MLTGENQYDTGKFGKQDAAMGVTFDSFPPVLELQLKRFTYDVQLDTMVKVHDRCEFPEVLELDRYEEKLALRLVDVKFSFSPITHKHHILIVLYIMVVGMGC